MKPNSPSQVKRPHKPRSVIFGLCGTLALYFLISGCAATYYFQEPTETAINGLACDGGKTKKVVTHTKSKNHKSVVFKIDNTGTCDLHFVIEEKKKNGTKKKLMEHNVKPGMETFVKEKSVNLEITFTCDEGEGDCGGKLSLYPEYKGKVPQGQNASQYITIYDDVAIAPSENLACNTSRQIRRRVIVDKGKSVVLTGEVTNQGTCPGFGLVDSEAGRPGNPNNKSEPADAPGGQGKTFAKKVSGLNGGRVIDFWVACSAGDVPPCAGKLDLKIK